MFSFFKKKPPSAAPAAAPGQTTEPSSASGDNTLADPSQARGGERPRGALGWLNSDVGELFFGKKPAEAPATDAPAAAAPAAPASAPTPASPSLEPPRPSDAQGAPEQEEGGRERAGWLAKLKGGLQRTGSTIASAFVGAEIG